MYLLVSKIYGDTHNNSLKLDVTQSNQIQLYNLDNYITID